MVLDGSFSYTTGDFGQGAGGVCSDCAFYEKEILAYYLSFMQINISST